MPFLPIANIATNKKITDEPKFGTVIDNNDPLMLGRIKVEVQGIFEGNANSLPWIRRKTDTLFCGADCECFDVPEIGSVVEIRWCYDENTPVYSGAPYSKKHQTSEFTNNYPYESGFRFGKHLIKFDKASELLTITNGKATIMLDPLGGCSIACNELEITAKSGVDINTDLMHIKGNLQVDGTMSSTKGASGAITALSAATVDGGIITSCTTP